MVHASNQKKIKISFEKFEHKMRADLIKCHNDLPFFCF